MSCLKDLQKLFKELNSKTIVYNKVYYKITGSIHGAVLLSHLMYLYSEVFNSTEFYQSDAQLTDSLGFSIRSLRTAKASVKKYTVVTKKGCPAKNHWMILDEVIIDDVINLSTGGDKTSCVESDTSTHVENDTTTHVENDTTNNKYITSNKLINTISFVRKDDKNSSSKPKASRDVETSTPIKRTTSPNKVAARPSDGAIGATYRDTLYPSSNKTRKKRKFMTRDDFDLTDLEKSTFDTFWKLYPVKKAKKECESLWFSNDYHLISSAILDKLKKQVSEDSQFLEGFSPNPNTYLRGARWEDEVQVRKGKSISLESKKGWIKRASEKDYFSELLPSSIKLREL